MDKKYYKVIKSFEGFQTNAEVGDIVTIGWWDGNYCIMKDGKALCDYESPCHKQYCELIND